jgi:hypothetical protein
MVPRTGKLLTTLPVELGLDIYRYSAFPRQEDKRVYGFVRFM